MANNPALYNAALSGGTGGAQARWITDPVAANYATFRSAVIAFATAVDAAIPAIVGGASAADCQLLQSICQGVTAGRLISSATSGDYTDIAAAVAALFLEQQGGLDPAGTGMAALSTAWWVDFAADAAKANGSAETPYKEVNAAVAAAIASGLAAVTLMIVPGTYLTDVAINTSGTLLSLTLFGMATSNGVQEPNQAVLQNVTWQTDAGGVSRVTFRNVTVSGNITITDVSGSRAIFFDSSVVGNIVNVGQTTNYEFNNTEQQGTLEGGNVIAKDCIDVFGIGAAGVTITGSLELYQSFAGNVTTCAYVKSYGKGGVGFGVGATVVAGGVGFEGAIECHDGVVGLNGVSIPGFANAIIMRDCIPPTGLGVGGFGNVTFTGAPGTINMDSTTFGVNVDTGVPIVVTNGAVHVPVGYADIIVAVPAVAAAALDYLDVSTVGTPLEGIVADSPIVVNPKGDIEAAGATNGGLMQARVSATSTVRLAFKGALTGGNVTMRFSTP